MKRDIGVLLIALGNPVNLFLYDSALRHNFYLFDWGLNAICIFMIVLGVMIFFYPDKTLTNE